VQVAERLVDLGGLAPGAGRVGLESDPFGEQGSFCTEPGGEYVILIHGDRIEAVEPRGDLARYPDYRALDLAGATLLPGLIDAHCHLTVPFIYDVTASAILEMSRQIALNFRNCVLSGVTTVRDLGGFPARINAFRTSADRNQIPGPRVVSSLSPIGARRDDVFGARLAGHDDGPDTRQVRPIFDLQHQPVQRRYRQQMRSVVLRNQFAEPVEILLLTPTRQYQQATGT